MWKIIDVHAHYGKWFFPIEADSPQAILHICRRFGIEKVIFSSTNAVVYDMAEGNRELSRLLEAYPQFYGYVTLNPNYIEASKQEIQTYLASERFLGVKLHPNYSGQALDSSESQELIKEFYPYGKPLLVHTWGESGVNAVTQVAKAFPSLQIIMAHMGGDGLEGRGWRAAIKAAKNLPNTYLEVCGSVQDRDRIREAVDAVGAERILFGSDMTLINPVYIIGVIEDADIPREAKELILYENAKRLFNL